VRLSALLLPIGALLLLLLTLAVARPSEKPVGAKPIDLAGATGRVVVQNRHDGLAVLVARRLAPGGAAGGSIRLRNTGTRVADVRLSQTIVSARRGRGGRPLDKVLRLTVREGSDGAVVFAGAIRKLTSRTLRPLAPGRSRRYTFAVVLSPTADNRYQAASLVVRYRWKASGVVTSTRTNRGR
jgi:hypothetical protein